MIKTVFFHLKNGHVRSFLRLSDELGVFLFNLRSGGVTDPQASSRPGSCSGKNNSLLSITKFGLYMIIMIERLSISLFVV